MHIHIKIFVTFFTFMHHIKLKRISKFIQCVCVYVFIYNIITYMYSKKAYVPFHPACRPPIMVCAKLYCICWCCVDLSTNMIHFLHHLVVCPQWCDKTGSNWLFNFKYWWNYSSGSMYNYFVLLLSWVASQLQLALSYSTMYHNDCPCHHMCIYKKQVHSYA